MFLRAEFAIVLSAGFIVTADFPVIENDIENLSAAVLRFFAFLAVFLYHFTRPVELYVQHGVPRLVAVLGNGLMQGGVFGVDLFFVLSAYLITELLLREKEACGSLDVRG